MLKSWLLQVAACCLQEVIGLDCVISDNTNNTLAVCRGVFTIDIILEHLCKIKYGFLWGLKASGPLGTWDIESEVINAHQPFSRCRARIANLVPNPVEGEVCWLKDRDLPGLETMLARVPQSTAAAGRSRGRIAMARTGR